MSKRKKQKNPNKQTNSKRKKLLKKVTIIQCKTNSDYTYREKFCTQKYLPTLFPFQVSFVIFKNKALIKKGIFGLCHLCETSTLISKVFILGRFVNFVFLP